MEISLHKYRISIKSGDIGKVLQLFGLLSPFCKTFFSAVFEVTINMSQFAVIQHITLYMCAFIKVVLVPDFHSELYIYWKHRIKAMDLKSEELCTHSTEAYCPV